LIYFFININNTWKIQINISNNRVHRKQVQIKHLIPRSRHYSSNWIYKTRAVFTSHWQPCH